MLKAGKQQQGKFFKTSRSHARDAHWSETLPSFRNLSVSLSQGAHLQQPLRLHMCTCAVLSVPLVKKSELQIRTYMLIKPYINVCTQLSHLSSTIVTQTNSFTEEIALLIQINTLHLLLSIRRNFIQQLLKNNN